LNTERNCQHTTTRRVKPSENGGDFQSRIAQSFDEKVNVSFKKSDISETFKTETVSDAHILDTGETQSQPRRRVMIQAGLRNPEKE